MEYFKELTETKIFKSANEFECQAMVFCFKARFKYFEKGDKIIEQDSALEEVILLLKGQAVVENIDEMGNKSVLLKMKKGDVYGLEAAYSGINFNKDSIIATEKSLVMFMNKYRLITPCENRCKRHEIVTKHLTQILAERNQTLLDKITFMSKKTIREKLLSYFSSLSQKSNSNYFYLPYSKTDLASFLGVDRSAMSTELTRMKNEGLIDFDGRQFQIKKIKKTENSQSFFIL